MVFRVLLVYLVIELAVVVALVSTIGWGWTMLLLVTTFVAGLVVAGAQIGHHVRRLLTGWQDPDLALTDSVLIALGAVLVAVPGLASTMLGVLCVLPPARAAARPVLKAAAVGRLGGWLAATPVRPAGTGDYIDGVVIDVTDIEPPALPARPGR